MKKMSLYKFIHIPLLKNDVHLKQKHDKQPKKRNKAITQIFYKKKKKSCLFKKKKKKNKQSIVMPTT